MSAPRPTGVFAQIGQVFRNAWRLGEIRSQNRMNTAKLRELDAQRNAQKAKYEATKQAILGQMDQVQGVAGSKKSDAKAEEIVDHLAGRLVEMQERQAGADAGAAAASAAGDAATFSKDVDAIASRLSGRLMELEERKEADAKQHMSATPASASVSAAAAEFANIETAADKAQHASEKDTK
jgi:hypothetical protein